MDRGWRILKLLGDRPRVTIGRAGGLGRGGLKRRDMGRTYLVIWGQKLYT